MGRRKSTTVIPRARMSVNVGRCAWQGSLGVISLAARLRFNTPHRYLTDANLPASARAFHPILPACLALFLSSRLGACIMVLRGVWTRLRCLVVTECERSGGRQPWEVRGQRGVEVERTFLGCAQVGNGWSRCTCDSSVRKGTQRGSFLVRLVVVSNNYCSSVN
ncbi:hypothetical protein M427DRAFT_183643 [Gonapodya prolifera JEL478]|uniref:Uncharacterized protein n=1 Tax=Gonapodya prolifera (strain JEL478) TaxID=1344416 RepID=A0A139A0L6_GONPJ|nr:hypothetical protein M427DRAFT_183643 [Gonapodya prolifera JEL478]|eukprot:KXS10282.1 hypothetical protein M427DRAFT_183643 [Gonapodya prolifera JEL478]